MSGSRLRSTMCESIIRTYDTVAPNTAMLMSSAPAAAIPSAIPSSGPSMPYVSTVASTKPIAAGTTSARYGVLRPPVTDSVRGR